MGMAEVRNGIVRVDWPDEVRCQMLGCGERRDPRAFRRQVCTGHAEGTDYMTDAELASLAREDAHMKVAMAVGRAVDVLIETMDSDREELRIKAAESLLDRGGIPRGVAWTGRVEVEDNTVVATEVVRARLERLAVGLGHDPSILDVE